MNLQCILRELQSDHAIIILLKRHYLLDHAGVEQFLFSNAVTIENKKFVGAGGRNQPNNSRKKSRPGTASIK